MNREQAKDYINTHPEVYFKKAKKSGYICPLCKSGAGVNGTGIEKIPNKKSYKCFNCEFSGDIIDFIGGEYRLDGVDKFNKAYEMYNISIDNESHYTRNSVEAPETPIESEKTIDYTLYYKECAARMSSGQGLEYMTSRGISKKTIERFGIGYDNNYNNYNQGRVIIPLSNICYVARAVDKAEKKILFPRGGKIELFNSIALSKEEPVFIVEGAIDALSIAEAGSEAVAFNGSGENKLINYIKENKPHCPLIILPDNDKEDKNGRKTGDEKAQKLYNELVEIEGVQVYIAAGIFKEYKDANAYLMADKHCFCESIQRLKVNPAEYEARIYREKNSDYKLYMDYRNIESVERFNIDYIKTGIGGLDDKLGGGLMQGLYCIGAVPSLGKTTFAMEMADNIARSGQDVLIFSLEMSSYELAAKNISRYTGIKAYAETVDKTNAKEINAYLDRRAVSAQEISSTRSHNDLTEAKKSLMQEGVNACIKYSENIMTIEGNARFTIEKIGETVKRHRLITGKSPVVLIDYLQIIFTDNTKLDKRGSIDYIVTELKRISRDNKSPVIVISAFSRDNYYKEVHLGSFKESGGIEYSADVLLGMQFYDLSKHLKNEFVISNKIQFNEKPSKKKNPRQIEVHILKNRNGETGGKLKFNFYTKYNFFEEVKSFEGEADD